jgi:integrase
MVWMPEHYGIFRDYIAANDPDNEFLWYLQAQRGLRRGETCALPWYEAPEGDADIDVTTQFTEDGSVLHEGPPKSESSIRTIPLGPEGVRLLREHRDREEERKRRLGPAWTETGRVFTNPDGSALWPRQLSYRFRQLTAPLDLPPTRLHDLRHVTATLLLAAGNDMKVVQTILGHASLAITSDIYTSVLPDLLNQAVTLSDAIVPRAGHVEKFRNTRE